MSAKKKITERQLREIMRYRAAGESCESVGDRLGYHHSTIARAHAKELEQQRAVEAAEAERKELRKALVREMDDWITRFDPSLRMPLWHSPEQRLRYYASRRLENPRMTIPDDNDARSGRLTPGEKRALAGGRQMFKYEQHEIDERFPGCS